MTSMELIFFFVQRIHVFIDPHNKIPKKVLTEVFGSGTNHLYFCDDHMPGPQRCAFIPTSAIVVNNVCSSSVVLVHMNSSNFWKYDITIKDLLCASVGVSVAFAILTTGWRKWAETNLPPFLQFILCSNFYHLYVEA